MAADGGGAARRDRLSDLPDDILVSILSLLLLDQAARCTVLASRWRRLFPSTLLDFDAYMPGRRNVMSTVNSILAAHPTAPVRSFRAVWISFRGDEDPSAGGWLQELARRGVQELFLHFNFAERQRIPASLFACASLTRLNASHCTFPDVASSPLMALLRLTEIDLFHVTISDDSLRAMLSHCTALERLRVHGRGTGDRVHVRSPSLKILTIDGDFDELFIEYAPNLVWLFSRYMHVRAGHRYRRGVHLKVVQAPKLEFLGYLAMGFHAIEIGKTIFKEDCIQVKTLMPSLRTLAIEVSYTSTGYINWIIQLLELFPCLETLHIKSDTRSVVQAAAPESWDVLRYIPCVDNRLKKVVFQVYRGHEWQKKIAKFFHRRSRFLKTMEFHCMDDNFMATGRPHSEEWVRKQQELLCLDSRASRDARFLFFKHMLDSDLSICHREWYKQINYYSHLYDV